jgi:DNA-binding transcriptional ArsR family regulator
MSRPHADESVFRAIADPSRRRILDLLRHKEMTPGDLLGEVSFGLANLTFHLRVLRSAGLVAQRRTGRQRVYRLNAKVLHAPLAWLRQYELALKSGPYSENQRRP